MKIFNKIFVPAEWKNVPGNFFETEDSPGATKYIRKEAFIESALSWLREYGDDYIDCYSDKCLLLEDFEKAMKEI